MNKNHYRRPLITGLSLAVLSTSALAYGNHHQNSDGYHHSTEHMVTQQQPHQHGCYQTTPLHLSSQIITELNLSETQQQALDQAQAATAAMREDRMHNRQHQRSAIQPNSSAQTFDPREMFEQQNQRMQAKLQTRQALQEKWLAFWDSLDEKQQNQWQEAIVSETGHGHRGQHRH